MRRFSYCFAVMLLAIVTTACGRAEDVAPPVATPSLTLPRSKVTVGSPLEIKYGFAVANDAPAFTEDYWVFVHFLDANGELMWTDDHLPPVATRAWKPGQRIEYSRTMFVPKFPYTGSTQVEMGLYSRKTGERLPLSGETNGQRSYQVAAFDLQMQSDKQFVVFKDGWHPTEVADDRVGTEWQWSRKEATLTFRNPKRDAEFYLELDRPGAPDGQPAEVELRIGDAVVEKFAVSAIQPEVRKFPLTASQLGSAETVEMRLSVDRTFIPAAIPEAKSNDPRELGVRVFRAHIEPR